MSNISFSSNTLSLGNTQYYGFLSGIIKYCSTTIINISVNATVSCSTNGKSAGIGSVLGPFSGTSLTLQYFSGRSVISFDNQTIIDDFGVFSDFH